MADYVKGFGALGKLAMSLGRELFGFQIRANPKIAELAERAGVTMDTIDAAPPEALSAILDRAARQGAIDPRDANNITIQIAKEAQEAMPVSRTTTLAGFSENHLYKIFSNAQKVKAQDAANKLSKQFGVNFDVSHHPTSYGTSTYVSGRIPGPGRTYTRAGFRLSDHETGDRRKATDDFLTIIDNGNISAESLVAEVQSQIKRAKPELDAIYQKSQQTLATQADALDRWAKLSGDERGQIAVKFNETRPGYANNVPWGNLTKQQKADFASRENLFDVAQEVAPAMPTAAELRRQANIDRFGYDPNDMPDVPVRTPTDDPGFESYLEQVNPNFKRIAAEDRPNLMMGDMYGMLPRNSEVIRSENGVTFYRAPNGDRYATAFNPDVGEQDVVGYITNRGDGTELAVTQQMQGQGIGGELQYMFRQENPNAATGGLTEAGERSLQRTYDRLSEEIAKDAQEAVPAMEYPIAPIDEWYGEANYQQTGGKMKNMSPDEFLSSVRPLDIDEGSRDNIDDLKNHMMSGRTLDPLNIFASGKEDGRHRAVAAKELGIQKVPVIIFGGPE